MFHFLREHASLFFFCTLVLRVLYNVQFCFLFELSWRQWLLNAFRGSRETLALHLIQRLFGSRELHLHLAIRVVVVPGQPAYNRLSRGKGRGDLSSYVRGVSSILHPTAENSDPQNTENFIRPSARLTLPWKVLYMLAQKHACLSSLLGKLTWIWGKPTISLAKSAVVP